MSPLRNQQGSSEGLRDRPVGQSLSRPATAPHDSGSFMGAVTNHLVDAIDATKPRRVVRVRPGTSGGSAQGMQHLLSRRMQTGNGAQGLRGWTSSKGQEIAAAGSCGGSLPTGWERYRLERSTGCLAHESTLPSAKPSLAAANHGKSRAQRPASEADQTKDTRESMVGSRFSGSEASEQVHGSGRGTCHLTMTIQKLARQLPSSVVTAMHRCPHDSRWIGLYTVAHGKSCTIHRLGKPAG